MKKETNKLKLVESRKYSAADKRFSNLPGEKWGAVPGFEDTHKVSNYGRIKRLERVIEINGRKPLL